MQGCKRGPPYNLGGNGVSGGSVCVQRRVCVCPAEGLCVSSGGSVCVQRRVCVCPALCPTLIIPKELSFITPFRPVASHPGGGGGGMQARIRDFLKGGWGEDIHKQPPPPLDIVRVTSSALRKMGENPHSWTFTSPPLDITRVTSSTFQGGGWSVPVSRTLCIGFQYWDKFKGGGGDHPCPPPPPPDPPLVWLGCL